VLVTETKKKTANNTAQNGSDNFHSYPLEVITAQILSTTGNGDSLD